MRARGLSNDAGNQETGYEVAIGVTQNQIVVDDLFTGEYDFGRSECRLARYAKVAPQLGVALPVRPLHVENGHIGPDGANRQQLFVGKRAAHRCKLLPGSKVAAFDRPGRQKW